MNIPSIKEDLNQISTDDLLGENELSVGAYKACGRTLMYTLYDIFSYYKSGGQFINMESSNKDISIELENLCKRIETSLAVKNGSKSSDSNKHSADFLLEESGIKVITRKYNSLSDFQKGLLELKFTEQTDKDDIITPAEIDARRINEYFSYSIDCYQLLLKVLRDSKITVQEGDIPTNYDESIKVLVYRINAIHQRIVCLNKSQMQFIQNNLMDSRYPFVKTGVQQYDKVDFEKLFTYTIFRIDRFFSLLLQLGVYTSKVANQLFGMLSDLIDDVASQSDKEIVLNVILSQYGNDNSSIAYVKNFYETNSYLPMFWILQHHMDLSEPDKADEFKKTFRIVKGSGFREKLVTPNAVYSPVVAIQKIAYKSLFNSSSHYLRVKDLWEGYDYLINNDVICSHSPVIQQNIIEKEQANMSPDFILNILGDLYSDEFVFLERSGKIGKFLEIKYLIRKQLCSIFDFTMLIPSFSRIFKLKTYKDYTLTLDTYLSTSKLWKTTRIQQLESIKRVLAEMLVNELSIRINERGGIRIKANAEKQIEIRLQRQLKSKRTSPEDTEYLYDLIGDYKPLVFKSKLLDKKNKKA